MTLGTGGEDVKKDKIENKKEKLIDMKDELKSYKNQNIDKPLEELRLKEEVKNKLKDQKINLEQKIDDIDQLLDKFKNKTKNITKER